RQLQTETATPSRPRFVIEEVTTGSVLLCAIRREVAQISNAFDIRDRPCIDYAKFTPISAISLTG
ncbi:hypothetical protein, partial [Burkholderia pseudomallei]|uniref:hypothetical protein n=1 Tax=Burkholderia pseudomallei TaxID=28450 RepID=UPI001C724885